GGNVEQAHLYLKGISTNLKPNDPLLINFVGKGSPEFFRVQEVIPDAASSRTRVILQSRSSPAGRRDMDKSDMEKAGVNLITELTSPPSVPPANSRKLIRNLNDQFGSKKNDQDGVSSLLKTLS